jgi:hypothetical protein
VDAAHRYVLPVVSGVCVLLGGVLLFRGPEPIGPYPSLAILALGTGSLLSSLAYLRWKHAKPDPAHSTVRTPVLAVGPVLCSECSEPIPPSLEWEDLFYGRYEVPSRGDGTAAALRVLFTPTSAADQLWTHWLPTEVGQLPAELLGPIPESAYYSPEPALSTAPVGPTPEPAFLPGSPPIDPKQPLAPGQASTPESVAPDLPDLMSPVSVPQPAPPKRSPTSPTLPGAKSAVEGEETPRWMRSILAEAMNPVPPHLRVEPEGTTESRGPLGPSLLAADIERP